MPATTEIVPVAASSADNPLFSPYKWASILSVTPKAVRNECGKGLIARDRLPARWREHINALMIQHSVTSIEHLVHVLSSDFVPVQTGKPFASKSEKTRDKAVRVREVMLTYFDTLASGVTKKAAVMAAQQRWAALFDGKPCSEKTIYRKEEHILARLAPGKSPQEAPLDLYTDNKDVAHPNARLESRGVVPKEFILAFRAKCIEPGVEHVSSAFRAFEIAWQSGEVVPGFGTAPRAGERFPIRLKQVRKYAPSHAARLLGARGKAAARALALPTQRRTNAELQLAEKIVFDDTRLNIFALDDLTGRVVELKSYWAMDVATRRIIGWLVREAGSVKAADVDSLVARVLQSWGFAHPNAGYATMLKFERGCVSCSPAKQVLLEGLYPGQIFISRTDMDGGRNFGGDYTQEGSGHWMGKGEIESFMRTLGFFCEHLKGQRGSIWARQPAQLGSIRIGKDGKQLLKAGSILDEAALVAKSGRALAYLESHGLDSAPSAADAAKRFGLHAPLYYVHEVLNALPAVVNYYNTLTEHRREGFEDVRYERPEGGIRFRKESSDERAARLLLQLQAKGIAPVSLPDSDAALLLYKARTVTVTRNGVRLEFEGKALNYFAPHSAAILEAMRLTTGKKECVALFDEENPDRIHLLQNSVASWTTGQTAIYWETLPLDTRAPSNDKAALAASAERTRQNHNRVARELALSIEPTLVERDKERQSNIDTLRSVTIAHGGLRTAAPGSDLSAQVAEASAGEVPTRQAQQLSAEEEYVRSLQQLTEE